MLRNSTGLHTFNVTNYVFIKKLSSQLSNCTHLLQICAYFIFPSSVWKESLVRTVRKHMSKQTAAQSDDWKRQTSEALWDILLICTCDDDDDDDDRYLKL